MVHIWEWKRLFHSKNGQGKIDKYPLFENLIDEIRIKRKFPFERCVCLLRILGNRLSIPNLDSTRHLDGTIVHLGSLTGCPKNRGVV
jgi:hypothetical protein